MRLAIISDTHIPSRETESPSFVRETVQDGEPDVAARREDETTVESE